MHMSDHEILYDYNHAADQASQVRILAELNAVDVSTMRNKLMDLGVKDVPLKPSIPKRKGCVTFDEKLAFELHGQGMCDPDLAAALGVSRNTISDWRKRNNLKIHRKLPDPKEPETEPEAQGQLDDSDQPCMGVGGLLRAARQIMAAFPQAEVTVSGQRLRDIRVHVVYGAEGDVSSAEMELILEGR